MPKSILINSKIKNFNQKIIVDGDKSISIRSLIFVSIANEISSKNLLESEDVLNALKFLKLRKNSKK